MAVPFSPGFAEHVPTKDHLIQLMIDQAAGEYA
jgi:hypothetical protein